MRRFRNLRGDVPTFERTDMPELRRSGKSYAAIGAEQGIGGAIAAGLSDLGKSLITKHQKEQRTAEATYLAGMELNLDDALAKAAMRHEGDHTAFQTTADKLRAEWLPNVPDTMREAAGVVFDRKVQKLALPILKQEDTRQKAEANATFLTTQSKALQEATAAMRSGDQEAVQEWSGKYMAARELRFANGWISPEQYVRDGETIRWGLERSKWMGAFDKAKAGGLGTAEGFIKEFAKREDLHPDERDKLLGEMTRDLTDLKTEHRLAVADVREQASVAVEAVTSGRSYANMDTLREQARSLGDTDTLTALREAESLADGAQEFAALTPQQMASAIEERRKGVKTDFDNKRLDVFEGIYKKAVKGLAEQPLTWVDQNGVRELTPVDFTNPESMAQRVKDGTWVRERYGLRDTPLLKPEEADQLKAVLGKASGEEKAAIMAALTVGFGEKHLPAILKSVAADDPEFAHAGVIGLQDGNAAKAIIVGQEIRKLEPQYVPTQDSTYRSEYQRAMPPEAMRGFGPDFTKGMEDTVLSVYANLSRQADDNSKTIDGDRLQEAVRIVTGGIVEYDRNGILSGNFKTIAPERGMTSGQFTGMLDRLTDNDVGEPYLPTAGKRSGGRITAKNIRDHGTLIALGRGRYAVDIGGQMAVTKDGTPYVLDLKAILDARAAMARVSPPMAE